MVIIFLFVTNISELFSNVYNKVNQSLPIISRFAKFYDSPRIFPRAIFATAGNNNKYGTIRPKRAEIPQKDKKDDVLSPLKDR